jgi:hypothetical protein
MYSAKRRFRLFRHPAWRTTYDTLTLDNSGGNDVFVCKYTDTGRLLWATRIAGAGSDQGIQVFGDSNGNVYVTGIYASSPVTIFNSDGPSFGTLTNAGGNDVFVVKYNASGIAQWATRIGGTVNDSGNSIAVDDSGNVYVVGTYISSPVTIFNADGPSFGTLTHSGSNDAFIVKYNASGVAQWATRIAAAGSDQSRGIGVDGSGNVYFAGFYASSPVTIFNAGGGPSFGTLTNSGAHDAFIVKYNSSGTAQWSTRIAGAGNDFANNLTVDTSGNVYLIGDYASSPVTIFNSGGGPSFGTLTNSGGNDAFIVKYNSSGTAQWATRIAGAGSDAGIGITVDQSGNVYVAGYYNSSPVTIFNSGGGPSFGTLTNSGSFDAFIVKYNAAGVAQWATRIAGTESDLGRNIAVDATENVYITAEYSSSPVTIFNADGPSFGTLTNSGASDTYIVKYNSLGTVQWATRIDGLGSEVGHSISFGGEGSFYIAGFYTSNPLTLRSVGF